MIGRIRDVRVSKAVEVPDRACGDDRSICLRRMPRGRHVCASRGSRASDAWNRCGSELHSGHTRGTRAQVVVLVFALLVVGFAFPGRAYAYVAFPPGYTWDDLNSDWEDFDQKLKDRISHLWKDIGDGFSGSGGGDIEGGGDSGSGAGGGSMDEGDYHLISLKDWAPHEHTGALDIDYVAVPNDVYTVLSNFAKNFNQDILARVGSNYGYVVMTVNPDNATFNESALGRSYVLSWNNGFQTCLTESGYTTSDISVLNGKKCLLAKNIIPRELYFGAVVDGFYPVYAYGWDSWPESPSTPEPESPTIHEHPDYPVNDSHPDGSGDTYTYNVYDGDDVAFTVEVEGTDLSPITLRLDDLIMMFSDFANEFSWFEDTLLSLLMRIFTMQLYIYDEIADLLDGLETLDHSTDDLVDLSTVERYLEDILSAVTNFADEDTGVILMRGYLKGIFDDFGQLLQLLGDWPEYPAVEPSSVTVEPTDLDPVLTELRKIEDLLKGTGVKAPVADPDESDPEKTIGMRIGEKMDELKDRFPFSLPWDIFAILNLLRADPVAPQFDLPVFGSEESVHVDLSVWDSVAVVTRGGTTILFALGLALRSRSLLASWGGVSGD